MPIAPEHSHCSKKVQQQYNNKTKRNLTPPVNSCTHVLTSRERASRNPHRGGAVEVIHVHLPRDAIQLAYESQRETLTQTNIQTTLHADADQKKIKSDLMALSGRGGGGGEEGRGWFGVPKTSVVVGTK